MAHTYNVDTGAWVQDPQEGWVSSKVVEKKINGSKVLLVFELTGGSRTGEVRAYISTYISPTVSRLFSRL